LTDPAYAYTPFVPAAEKTVKVPAWLNDPRYYHNRGDSTFAGESARYGDFAGLDDLMTEDPRVVAGFIAIYGSWIDRFGIDGFRVDTARHVN
ncbi:alpha-amylase family glycosyl hydrolase, partial [Acinetobacter baumannii]